MRSKTLIIYLGSLFLLDSYAFAERRLTNSQYANIDFLQNEGNRKPTSPLPTDHNQRVGSINPVPAIGLTGTSTTLSPIKQLINNFNDHSRDADRQGAGGVRPGGLPNTNINSQSGPIGSNNKNSNVGPTPVSPTTNINNQPNVRPNAQQNHNYGPTSTSALPNRNNQPNIGMNSQNNRNQNVNPTPTLSTPNRNVQPSVVIPQPRPNVGPQSPSRESFPSLPGTPTAASSSPTPKPISWSAVVSGKRPSAGGSTPTNNPSTTGGQPSHPANSLPTTPTNGAGLTPQTNPSGYPTLAESAKIGNKKNQNNPTTPAVELVSDTELKTISESLLSKDTNNAAKYITINYQAKTSSFSRDDLAPQPLITIQPAVWNIPTVAAMRVLFDNYEQDTTVNEYVTPLEKNEENAFMDAIMATQVIRQLMTFLKDKGVVTSDPKQQRDLLKSIWFNMYSRGQGRIGSSGFEHIFLSEVKNNEISGLHNWIYFYTEETANRANYLGYLKKVEIPNKGAILKLHFNMNGIDKPVDTMFVGTSPELEMALYSLCFLTRADKACPLSLGGENFNLRTHNYRYRSKNMIGSAFPEI